MFLDNMEMMLNINVLLQKIVQVENMEIILRKNVLIQLIAQQGLFKTNSFIG